jgi:hypothetical protein
MIDLEIYRVFGQGGYREYCLPMFSCLELSLAGDEKTAARKAAAVKKMKKSPMGGIEDNPFCFLIDFQRKLGIFKHGQKRIALFIGCQPNLKVFADLVFEFVEKLLQYADSHCLRFVHGHRPPVKRCRY